MSAKAEIDEASFHDAVSRNLRFGRFLLLIVGHGIREEVESMTEFLQQYAGFHFTLAIVELKLFDGPNGGCIVQPRVLARTTNIERGIVTCDDGRITIIPPVAGATAAGSSGTRMTITKERYLEQLERNFPGIAEKLNAFISKLEMCAVLPEFGINSMILRWHAETKSWNLGTIPSSGQVFTDQLGAFNAGLPDADKKYVENLAALVPGAVVEPSKKKTAWGAYKDHKTISIDALLADEAREMDGFMQSQNSRRP